MNIFSFFYRQKKKALVKGSFLVDVLMSLTILMMGLGAGYVLISQAIVGHRINKNKIIAINLAREGMESVRLVRDTNWLRYGAKKRICWNFSPDTDENGEWDTSDDSCTETSDGDGPTGQNNHPLGFMADGEKIQSYIPVLDTINYNWTLVENFYVIEDQPKEVMTENTRTCDTSPARVEIQTCPLPTDTGNWDARRSALVSGIGDVSSLIYVDNTTGLYTHSTEDSSGTPNEATRFHREIFLEYPNGTDGFFPESKSLDNQLLVTVKVWYPSAGAQYGRVVMETELTDYLGRSSWTD